jgi:hypothetical protein
MVEIDLVTGLVIDFLDTPDWIQFSYACKAVNAFKYVKTHMIHKQRNIRAAVTDKEMLLESLTKSTGTLFNVGFSRGLGLAMRWEIDDRFFAPLVGTIHTLNMAWCDQVTDKAFVHLKGIHSLDMRGCDRVSDAAFQYLAGIHTLNMAWCDQVTDKAFVHLKGIHSLDMRGCDRISDAAFAHLAGIHTLNMSFCKQESITDAAFVHLKGIHELSMEHCTQITDAALVHLTGIHALWTFGCVLITKHPLS